MQRDIWFIGHNNYWSSPLTNILQICFGMDIVTIQYFQVFILWYWWAASLEMIASDNLNIDSVMLWHVENRICLDTWSYVFALAKLVICACHRSNKYPITIQAMPSVYIRRPFVCLQHEISWPNYVLRSNKIVGFLISSTPRAYIVRLPAKVNCSRCRSMFCDEIQ